ncbi:MAG: GDP-mannose 4,6-dehydratase [Patescibacteria group bacterium]
MKKAIIIGSHGQDGQLLFDLLKRKNYSIVGIDRGKTNIDITNKKGVFDLVKKIKPDEFIIATGKQYSVADFAKITFQYLHLNWKKYVNVNPNLITKEQSSLIGNNLKLFKATGWKPKINFKEMIKTMLIQQGAKIYEK